MICADCTNAALNSGGVYCTVFHEQIFDETVANECSLFTQDAGEPLKLLPEPVRRPKRGRPKSALPGSAEKPVASPTTAVVGKPDELEGAQSLQGHLVVPFFGKRHQGHSLAEEVQRKLNLHFPGSAVKWEQPGD